MKSATVSLQRRVFGALGILLFAAGFVAPALAHHSAAMFDATKTVVHTGAVKQFLWTNPHSLLVLTVRNSDGVMQDYSYEANGPGYLVRNGWARETLKPGDKVTVTSNPLVDGRPGGNLLEVTLADGRKLSARPELTVEGETMNRGSWNAAAVAAATCLGISVPSFAQTALDGQYLSALAPENLAKPRPAPPFDLTGTWNMMIDPNTGMHEFLPLPKLTPAAQAPLAKYQDYQKRGQEYRDDPGACWPLGMPRMMTRFWPVQIIQLPTMVQLTTMFNNSVRWIYTDGRPHPPDAAQVYTYNGHSVGRWEGDTLVVDTVGMTDDHHWIQAGIPAGPKLHIVERYRMVEGGKAFEVEFVMTDPDNWEGEWKNTKRFAREERTDIEEHVCIYEQMRALPSFEYNIRE